MNDQDRDLILALAAGKLEGAEADEAAARIAADPELARELDEQRAAIEAISAAPAVAPMSADERTALRGELVAQLSLEPAVGAAPVVKGPARWWKPVMGLATAAAVIVGAFVILPGTLGGSDDSAEEFALVSETTSAESEEGAGGDAFSSAGEQSADGAADETTTTTPATAEPRIDGSALLDATQGQGPEALEEALTTPGLEKLQRFATERADELDRCLESLESELPAGDVVPLGTIGMDADEVLYLGITGNDGVYTVVTIGTSDCEIVDIDT